MEAYSEEWLAGEPVLRAIMYLVGLFDRPASAGCILALRGKPAIDGLTDVVVDLGDDAWRAAIGRLRDVRLIDPEDPAAPDALDAHPLVREWFGERLKQLNEAAWKAAHGRLYDYLRDSTKEGDAPSLEGIMPLYQAVAHGCRAGRHKEALHEIYVERICRRRHDQSVGDYAGGRLGALGSNLAAMSWFFDKPYEIPAATLTLLDRSWVLNEAAFGLRAQARFADALPAMRAAVRIYLEAERWSSAGIAASNLSDVELLTGEVAVAVETAEQSVAYGDRGAKEFDMIARRATYAYALDAAGKFDDAERLFTDAEQRQKDFQAKFPLLYSVRGYRYCDLLLSKRDWVAVRDRATKILEWESDEDSLLDRALPRLAIGRADLGVMLGGVAPQQHDMARDAASALRVRFDEVVNALLAAGTSHYVPRGLLARSAFRRSIGDWDDAAQDLDEIAEIAEQGPMRLFLCDIALERTRLAFAKIEAFAPLNGLIDDSPPKPAAPGAAAAARLTAEATEQLTIASDYIQTCGYHRRDEELAELEAVLRGERKFADLPPRV